MQWVAAACRPLKTEEFQEAAAVEPDDTQWNGEKIPDLDKLLQSCHGLVVRAGDRHIHFAHQTVLQYIFKSEVSRDLYGTKNVKSVEQVLFFKLDDAKLLVAQVCATYLQFADFQRSMTLHDERNQRMTINTVFKNSGPLAIPGTLGIHRRLYGVPQKLRGLNAARAVDLDFAKYLNRGFQRPTPRLTKKYGKSSPQFRVIDFPQCPNSIR